MAPRRLDGFAPQERLRAAGRAVFDAMIE